MKMTKKKVLVSALAVSLVAILSLGTLAWFSDEDAMVNNFYVADSENDGDVFAIDVWEYINNDTTTKVDEGKAAATDGVFKNIAPGMELHKEPHVENICDYDQWVRVKVKVTNHNMWVAATNNNYPLVDMINENQSLWLFDETKDFVWEDTTGNTVTYTFYLANKLAAKTQIGFFSEVSIPEGLTDEMVEQYCTPVAGDSTVDQIWTMEIKAQAVQYDYLGASSAREAFKMVPMN